MSEWFEYYLSFTVGNLKWWRHWFAEKTDVPQLEIIALIDKLLPVVESAIESCRPTLYAPDPPSALPNVAISQDGHVSIDFDSDNSAGR
mgnify:CR=1 FL=1